VKLEVGHRLQGWYVGSRGCPRS